MSERWRRGAMWFLASTAAAIAAVVSYSHIYDLGRKYGGTIVTARLLPLSVDLLILVGELMLLHEADSKGRRFVLGWVLVWSGILATLAANVTFGAQYGPVGALIWGWPAYSFILAAAGMVAIVKRANTQASGTEPADTADPADALWPALPNDAQTAALASLRATMAAGNPWSGRQVEQRFGLSRADAAKVREMVFAEANGHAPEGDSDDAG